MLSDEELDRLAKLGVELKQLEAVGADECDLGEQRRVAAKQRFKAKLLQYGERLIAQAREANMLRAKCADIESHHISNLVDQVRVLKAEVERLRQKADLADWAESIIKLNWDPTLTGDDSKLPKEIVDWLLRWKEANRDE